MRIEIYSILLMFNIRIWLKVTKCTYHALQEHTSLRIQILTPFQCEIFDVVILPAAT